MRKNQIGSTSEITEGYIISCWKKGVWLKKNIEDSRVYPVFINDSRELLEWELAE